MMLPLIAPFPIFIGHRQRTASLGFVADWCPIRGELAAFELRRIEKYHHFTFVPLSTLERAHVIVAEDDPTLMLAARRSDYANALRKPLPGLAALLELTNPNLSARIEGVAAFEEAAESGEASAEELREHIAAVTAILNDGLTFLKAHGRCESVAAVSALSMIVFAATAAVAAVVSSAAWVVLWSAGAVVSLVVLVVVMMRVAPMVSVRVAERQLAAMCGRFGVGDEAVREAVGAARERRVPVAKRMSVERLLERMRAERGGGAARR